MKLSKGAISKIEVEAVARPKEGETIQQLIERLNDLGQEIIEVREDGVVIGLTAEDLV